MASEFGIARGTLTQTAFDANSDYLLSNWQDLAGAGSGVFTADTEAIIEFSDRRVRTLSGRHYAVGGYRVSEWKMLLNTTMADYLETTIFQGEVSSAVTFSHYDVYRDTWYILNGYATYSELIPQNVNTQSNEWLLEYRIMFSNVTEADVS